MPPPMIFNRYAQYYDVFYQNKRYTEEIVYLEWLFRKYRKIETRTVLDLGCGTAGHMTPLLRNGYRVTGLDASGQMLEIARDKLIREGLRGDLVHGTCQDFTLNKKFDAVICLFSVINYAAANGDIIRTLRNIHTHMKKTSIFIFDFWNATTVVDYYNPKKRRNFRKNGMEVERNSATKIYPSQRKCEVHYTCILRRKGRLIRRDKERHVLRYFSIEEMADYLCRSGFQVVNMHPFLKPEGKIRRDSWDVTAVARRA